MGGGGKREGEWEGEERERVSGRGKKERGGRKREGEWEGEERERVSGKGRKERG